jgi:hypothetical protein
MEMLETFENEPAALRFMSGIFGDVTARARTAIADFDAFDIEALGDIAHLGNEVPNPNPDPNPNPNPNPNHNPNATPNPSPKRNPTHP